jgi:undecaprenyl-diphosphatase
VICLNLIQSADSTILLFIQDHMRNPVLDPVMFFFSVIGNAGFLWIALSVFLMLTKKHRRAGFDLLLCVAVCYILNDFLIKNLVQRERPFLCISELCVLLDRFSASDSWSFPSGHTCSSFAAAYALTKSFGKYGSLFYIPAVFISLSRLYVGGHYPSDVLAGALIGTVGSIVVYALRVRYIRLKPKS